MDKKIYKIDIPETVRVRSYDVDVMALVDMLRSYKQKSGLTNKQIAEKLDVPLTNVEHWFRKDKYASIPDEDDWYRLKELLKIDNNDFDREVMTFEERDGTFEETQRCYLPFGIAPTILVGMVDKVIIFKKKESDQKQNPPCWATDVDCITDEDEVECDGCPVLDLAKTWHGELPFT